MKTLWVKYRDFIILAGLVSLIWTAFDVKAIAGDAAKRSRTNQEMIFQIAKLAETTASNLELLMKLGAITDDVFEDLRMLPTTPQNENGEWNEEWYLVGDEAIYLIKAPRDCVTIEKIPFGEDGL